MKISFSLYKNYQNIMFKFINKRRLSMINWPVIGILSHVDSGTNDDIFPGRSLNYIDKVYADVLIENQMLPVMIPVNSDQDYIDQIFNEIDGLLGSGGGKIPARILDKEKIPSLKETAEQRYLFEEKLFKKALNLDLPFLGVCRTMQTINELTGGELNSKISYEILDALEHNQQNLGIKLDRPYHDIKISKESKLYQIIKKEKIKVNSWHSQSIKKTGEIFEITAETKDGVIEAIESKNHNFVIMLQFHPELMIKNEKIWVKLYQAFKKEALNYRMGKEKRI